MTKPIRVAWIAFYPAASALPKEKIKPAYFGKEHAAPWVRALGAGLLQTREIELRVFVHSRAVTQQCEGSDVGIPMTFIPKREPLRSDPYHLYYPGTQALRQAVAAYNPDLVHGFGAETGNGSIACRMGKPTVFFIQGIIEKYAPFLNKPKLYLTLKKRIERHVVRAADGIVAETEFARNWALSVNTKALVHVIPHALNTDFLDVQSSFSEKLALAAGSLDRRKGADMVVDAFIRTAKRAPGTTFVYIGAGELKSELEMMIRKQGLEERVQLVGHKSRDEIISYMNRASVMVIGSRVDTSPNIVTEAHAAGLPIVGSDGGGIPEMIDDGQDGYVVPVGDAELMSDRITTLLNNPDTCRTFGEAGRKKAAELNNPQRIANLHIDLYRDVLTRRGS